ncbi:oligoendopeptidase F [Metamycoplasma hominis]|uniref:Oligopeptidase F n=1 Tax=Metamycoplasma hominis TaxID=2098 RepID=A0A454CA01_METHO|nr:oligoendopeptidase F [Metamycoplasma hominis]AYN65518.1 oligoendopeptidase F [Metamycoplasma hominis]KGF61835.1 oligoendopeptidase F [Metamycoplasma hominis]QKX31498.1 oligoendopeptidase F [Metamycoplasma hominis]RBI34861.1 oligoendopeptidase F [Metamycoplasma hominis]
MLKKYNSYSDVEEKYKWDIEDILGNKTYQQLEDEYFDLYSKIIEIKDSKYNSLDQYVEYIELSKKFLILGNRISNYLDNKLNINIVDPTINKTISLFETKSQEYAKKLGSEANRIFQHKDKIKTWINDDRLIEVKKDLEATLQELDHKLSDDVENYLNDTASGSPVPEDIFSIISDSEVDFGNVLIKNKKIKITEGNRIALLKNKDEQVRKDVYFNYLNGYLKNKQSLARLLYQHIKEISVNALYRKYNSSLESILLQDHVDKKLLNIIYDAVQKHMYIFKKYNNAKKQFFKAKFNKKLEKWDYFLDLVNVKSSYTIEEAQKILLDVISIMPYEYPEVVKKAIDERWIDYINVPSKRSGAYSIGGAAGMKKIYILMNFDGTLESVNTLCHEMGHSMHSYFSNKCQSPLRSSYPIFLAEIASIFNELLLNDYLISKSKNIQQQFYLLDSSINDFIGTVLRQTMWSNFEFDLYNAIDENKPLNTYEEIEKLYVENEKKYSTTSKSIKLGDPRNVYSVMVPHFYYYFYVYKYALGYIVANVFFQKYKQEGQEALKNYINKFLSAGDIDWPANILKDAGVDIYNEDIYNLAFEVLNQKVDKYIKLGKKIFKNNNC